MKKKVVVQIPCLNEEKGIANVIKQIKKITKDEIFHCYKDKVGVKVFLEDYVYLSQLMINLYAVSYTHLTLPTICSV